MKGHWCRESAAHRRGSSKQSQVQNNSCASVATTVKPSKASLHAMHDESACEDGNRRSTEHGSNLNLSGNGLATRWPTLATNGQPWPAEADHGKLLAGRGHQQPTLASLGRPQEAAGHLWPPAANRGQREPATGGCWPTMAVGGGVAGNHPRNNAETCRFAFVCLGSQPANPPSILYQGRMPTSQVLWQISGGSGGS